jgi:excinuclease UvrABC helicase subunit UvrB
VSSLAIEENPNFIRPAREFESRYNEIPAAIRTELNADSDRDVLARMRHLARKKRMRQPNITDEEMADYLALAENCENFEQWLKSKRETLEPGPSRASIAWVLGTLAIVGLLATGLLTAIAVSVSGL